MNKFNLLFCECFLMKNLNTYNLGLFAIIYTAPLRVIVLGCQSGLLRLRLAMTGWLGLFFWIASPAARNDGVVGVVLVWIASSVACNDG